MLLPSKMKNILTQNSSFGMDMVEEATVFVTVCRTGPVYIIRGPLLPKCVQTAIAEACCSQPSSRLLHILSGLEGRGLPGESQSQVTIQRVLDGVVLTDCLREP